MLQDAAVRQQAISPEASYIIQAPAGSGKTALLTHRFLKLLALANAPEQVFALTFTRKAASEMRDRVLEALHACQGASPKPEQVWWEDARRVVERDHKLNWQLLSQPHRLNIMTLDAMCQWLLRLLPMEAAFVAHSSIDVFPERHYRKAAHACFEQVLTSERYQPLLLALLKHLDNRRDRILDLWVDMLATRDQWLPVIYQAHGHSKDIIEQALQQLQSQALSGLVQQLSGKMGESLRAFCVLLGEHVPGYPILQTWTRVNTLTLDQAKLLARLLLTGEGLIRKRIDHHVGFKRGVCDAQRYTTLKLESEVLFAQLSECKGFSERLEMIVRLPDPHYDLSQWHILQALLTLLPLLVAHLKITFEAAHQVDFIEVVLAASRVLGEEQSPTDLALYLDHAIQHLLIDEFQDTSFTQFALLKKLVAGWEKGDGRTLFIVGDPMQSIYRFRQAEVGLFLQVQREGVGSVACIPLSLTSNFRSSATLVNWVNHHAAQFFSRVDDMTLGAISFHASTAVKEAGGGAKVEMVELHDALTEAVQIRQWIEHELMSGQGKKTMAILVRSRAQLEWIIPQLQAHGIAFEGVELFSIAQLPIMQDLWSLTRALLDPFARLSWFCVLRSPYVGLSLSDLHALALAVPKGSLYFGLAQLDDLPLSSEGHARLKFVKDVFDSAYQVQDQYALAEWLLLVHQSLFGYARAEQEVLWKHMGSFFQLVDQFSIQNQIVDWENFEAAFKRLFISEEADCVLKIMTIHQAKGLEFDVVFLPGLSSQAPRPKQTLLKWMNLFSAEGSAPLWLLSPLKAAEENQDALYNYLERLEVQKERFEAQRLFYVAMTRAKETLYLTDRQSTKRKHSFRGLLACVNTAFLRPTCRGLSATSMDPAHNLTLDAQEQDVSVGRNGQHTPVPHQTSLVRLPVRYYQAPFNSPFQVGHEHPLLRVPDVAKPLGTIAHQWLQWVCENRITSVLNMPWAIIQQALSQIGLCGEARSAAFNVLYTQFERLFQDDVGRWLISPHVKAHNEHAVVVYDNGRSITYVIDRWFFDQDCYWVIDFKTGKAPTETIVAHTQQISRYIAALRLMVEGPVRGGIYYLASNQWVEISPVQMTGVV